MSKPDLTAVVVTYKTRELLSNCLASFYAELEGSGVHGKIIVVDNASADGTIEMLSQKFPEAILIPNSENYGPAKAFNQGIAQAIYQSDLILVLNSDIEIIPGTLKTMLDYLKENPEISGVSGPLMNPDQTRQLMKTHIWSFRKPDFNKSFPIEFIGTTFAMIRAAVYRKIGGYDENYYFYNEDLDWAERAKRGRIRFMYLPDAGVIHFLSKGSDQNRSRITRELYWSNIYYYKKFYPRLAWLSFYGMKVDLKRRARELKSKLVHADNLQEKERINQALEDLKVSRERMNQEFRTKRTPKIPFWN